jgi:hypothetical protein
MTAMIETRARGGQSSSQQFTTPVSMSSTPPTKKRTFVDCLDEIKRLREHENQVKEDTGVSPGTKQILVSRIQKEKKRVMVNAANIRNDDSSTDE